MFNISEYLSKFKHILTNEKIQKDVVISVVQEHTSIILEPDVISVKNGVVTFNVPPVMQSTLFIYKQPMEAKLRAVSDNKIHTIR